MKYLALKRKKDGAFVGGHDFSYSPPRARIADEWLTPMLFVNDERIVKTEIMRRKINLKNYEFVEIEVKEC